MWAIERRNTETGESALVREESGGVRKFEDERLAHREVFRLNSLREHPRVVYQTVKVHQRPIPAV